MSEVKRYEFVYENDFGDEFSAFCRLEVDGDYVEFSDFDRVTAERDAALGREAECQRQLGDRWKDIETLQSSLESADASSQTLHEVITRIKSERDTLQQRLTAADERVDLLEGLLIEFREMHWSALPGPLIAKINAALKPAERCTVSTKDQALLDAGDYTPEELFGVGGKPSCPKCAS